LAQAVLAQFVIIVSLPVFPRLPSRSFSCTGPISMDFAHPTQQTSRDMRAELLAWKQAREQRRRKATAKEIPEFRVHGKPVGGAPRHGTPVLRSATPTNSGGEGENSVPSLGCLGLAETVGFKSAVATRATPQKLAVHPAAVHRPPLGVRCQNAPVGAVVAPLPIPNTGEMGPPLPPPDDHGADVTAAHSERDLLGGSVSHVFEPLLLQEVERTPQKDANKEDGHEQDPLALCGDLAASLPPSLAAPPPSPLVAAKVDAAELLDTRCAFRQALESAVADLPAAAANVSQEDGVSGELASSDSALEPLLSPWSPTSPVSPLSLDSPLPQTSTPLCTGKSVDASRHAPLSPQVGVL